MFSTQLLVFQRCSSISSSKLLLAPCKRLFRIANTVLDSSPGPFSFRSPFQHEDIKQLPQSLNVLNDAHKMRINQLKLTRIGTKPAKQLSIKEFEVVDTLNNDKQLLFIRIYHSMIVEEYELRIFEKDPGSAEIFYPCLSKILLERNHTLHTIAARLYLPPEKPTAYIYDLEGVYRTAIIEDGEEKKCLYQLSTDNPSGWAQKAKIVSGRGDVYIGHIRKLEGYNRNVIMVYMKVHENMDVASKCILIGASIYLMSFDYVR